MAKRLTEIEAIEKIKKILPDNINFLGWKEGKWISTRKSSAIFYCTEHRERFIIKFSNLDSYNIIWCSKCRKENRKEALSIYNDESIFKNKLKDFLLNNPHIKFIGYKEGKFLGKSTTLLLKCTKHNVIVDNNINNFNINFLNRKGKIFHCPECIKEDVSNRRKTTPKKAQTIVNELFKDINPGFDYSKVQDTFTSYDNDVTLICPKHGEFKIKFRTLMDKRNISMCPECLHERISFTEDQAIEKINESISYKNSLGFSIKFLGFLNNKWEGNTTKLILHCDIHNKTWNTTTFNNFMKEGMIGCPMCAAEHRRIISIKEDMCYKLLLKYINNYKINRQFLITAYDSVCKRIRNIFVDFFIEELNLVVEYDGEQHYQFLPYFKKDYIGFIDQVNRDNCLKNYCKENSINLLRISYKDNNRLEEVIKAFFVDGKDITTKVDPILLPIKYEGGTVNG